MDTILKDVNAVVGVTGSFVCDGEGQVLAKALPGVFDKAMLSPVGRTMAQTIAGLRIARRRKVGDLDLLYDQGRLIVKSVEDGCLCILCVRRINVPLLNLTANVAVRNLKEKIKALKPTQEAPLQEADVEAAQTESLLQEAETELESEPAEKPDRDLDKGFDFWR
jgi:predicted regulator of Ras-like GTPase activity (Roadblock/LC7/MglB family)